MESQFNARGEELLESLKREMLLAQARARGAQKAFELESEQQARDLVRTLAGAKVSFLGLRGLRVTITFSNGPQDAILDRVGWSQWPSGGDPPGPVLYGQFLLRNGKPSKVCRELCSVSYAEKGFVKFQREGVTRE